MSLSLPLLAALDAVEAVLMKRTYDPRVQDLADLFLADKPGVTDHDRADLAAEIQGCIEEWLEDRSEPPSGRERDDAR